MEAKKTWNIHGPKKWSTLINPLRNYIERRVPDINKQAMNLPGRPDKIVNLSIGDPARYKNFKLNPKLMEIVAEGVGKFDGYTQFIGSESCRQAIAEFYNKIEPVKVDKNDVFLTCGGSLALWLSIAVLCDPGDNFLFPEAGFPLSNTIAKSLGIQTKFYKLKRDENWQVDIDSLRKQRDQKTKFVLVIDPSNPLGSVWSEKHKKQIIAFCQEAKLPLVTDEIYETMTFNKQPARFSELRGDVPILKCSGLTKKWLVPGWRVGWLVVYGGDETKLIREGLKNILDVFLMPHSIIQGQMPALLEEATHNTYLTEKMKLLQKNQEYLRKQLENEDYCVVTDSNGALYSTISINTDRFEFKDTIEFSLNFFKEQNVLLFPGQFFFSENFLRLVMCCDFKDIKEFVNRFKAFSQKHLKK